MKTSLTAD